MGSAIFKDDRDMTQDMFFLPSMSLTHCCYMSQGLLAQPEPWILSSVVDPSFYPSPCEPVLRGPRGAPLCCAVSQSTCIVKYLRNGFVDLLKSAEVWLEYFSDDIHHHILQCCVCWKQRPAPLQGQRSARKVNRNPYLLTDTTPSPQRNHRYQRFINT